MDTIKKDSLYTWIVVFCIFIVLPFVSSYFELKKENEILYEYIKDIKDNKPLGINELSYDIYKCANTLWFKNPDKFLVCVDIAIMDLRTNLERINDSTIESLKESLMD